MNSQCKANLLIGHLGWVSKAVDREPTYIFVRSHLEMEGMHLYIPIGGKKSLMSPLVINSG